MDARFIAEVELRKARVQEYLESRPKTSDVNLERLVADPEGYYKEYMRLHKRKNSINGHTYFITLTTLPGYKDYTQWLLAIDRVLKRKFVKTFQICAEHLDTNLHAHILINATQQVQKKHFHSYSKATGATIIDVKKVSEDNGIDYYMKLENPVFDNFSEFQNFILTHYNGLS